MWSRSSRAEAVLTVQSLHFTSCVPKSCVPINLLSHQKTAGHPSPAGELLLSQSLPCSLSGSPAAPRVAAALVPFCLGQILCGLPASWQFVVWCIGSQGGFWLPGLWTEGWPECPVSGSAAAQGGPWAAGAAGSSGLSSMLEPGCNSRQTQLSHTSAKALASSSEHGVCAVTNPGRLFPCWVSLS